MARKEDDQVTRSISSDVLMYTAMDNLTISVEGRARLESILPEGTDHFPSSLDSVGRWSAAFLQHTNHVPQAQLRVLHQSMENHEPNMVGYVPSQCCFKLSYPLPTIDSRCVDGFVRKAESGVQCLGPSFQPFLQCRLQRYQHRLRHQQNQIHAAVFSVTCHLANET